MQWRTLLAVSAALVGPAVVSTQASALPSCATLATDPTNGLAGNPNIIGGTLTTAIVPAAPASNVTSNSTPDPTPATPAYCQVQFTYTTGLSGPANGYDVGVMPKIKINVILPLNSTDGGSGGTVNGGWQDYGYRQCRRLNQRHCSDDL